MTEAEKAIARAQTILQKKQGDLINLRNRLRAQREEIKKLCQINAELRKENEWLKTRAAV